MFLRSCLASAEAARSLATSGVKSGKMCTLLLVKPLALLTRKAKEVVLHVSMMYADYECPGPLLLRFGC